MTAVAASALALLSGCGPRTDHPAGSEVATTPGPASPTGQESRDSRGSRNRSDLPAGFVRVAEVDPTIVQEIRYAGRHNFVGRRLDGYEAPECWLTRRAATRLASVQRLALAKGFSLKVYDCYRPQRAVQEFVRWSRDPDDLRMKREFYPELTKGQLIPGGYIAGLSGHSRGSTIDVTLVPAPGRASREWVPSDGLVPCTAAASRRYPDTGIDMGTGFDCFDPLARTDTGAITGRQRKNRALLESLMRAEGFVNLPQEWWHFALEDEPFPDEYFDAVIR